jgi:polyhydroxybutyrate depolymerase
MEKHREGEVLSRQPERRSLQIDGSERSYLIYVPDSLDATRPFRILFDFHGATSDAAAQFGYSQFASLADRDGVILVHPDANKVFPDRAHELAGYWDSAWEARFRVRHYDIDFVLALVAMLKAGYPAATFVASGMSAGGDMVSALAGLTATPFSAFASVTYRYFDAAEFEAAAPAPTISFHGDLDRVCPIEGSGHPWYDPPVFETMRQWAIHNGHRPAPSERHISAEVTRYEWAGGDAKTVYYVCAGGGHTWPGSISRPGLGHTTRDISASQLIWQFFDEVL